MTKVYSTNWQRAVVAAAGIVLSILFGSIVLAETTKPIISSSNREGTEAVTVHDVTAKDGIVSGVVVNNTGHKLENVELLIRYDWLWNNEVLPGEDNPGRAMVHRLPAVPPAGEIPFSYQPESPLPERSDGHFSISVKVIGYTEVTKR